MLKGNKAQVGIEYAAVLVLFLFILVPVLYLGITEIQISGQVSQAKIAVDSIADAADRVYAQGPGATTTVEVYLPTAVNYATLNNHEVNINIFLPTGETTDEYALSKGNLTGTLPTLPGRHVLVVGMVSNGSVNIREAT
ncbi:MAG: hypothetical protein NTY73_04275 [Candidatus Micrarchaeota archaeon]|nr:hypothetical protein [Candidatus Micrarchaeota archaeon]